MPMFGPRQVAIDVLVLARRGEAVGEIGARQRGAVGCRARSAGHQVEVAPAGRPRPFDDPVGDAGDGGLRHAAYSCQLTPSRSVSAIAALGPQRAGRIGLGVSPSSAQAARMRVDPRPLRLDLVAAHEQGRVALDQVEQQPLVGDAPALLGEGVGQADVERHLAQARCPSRSSPGTLAIIEQADILFRLDADDQPVGLGPGAARGEDRMRHAPELDEDLGVRARASACRCAGRRARPASANCRHAP